MSPKAYSYIRFSTPKQEWGDSLRRQTELSERYAAKRGLVLDDTLAMQDMGLSGYHGYHRAKGALGKFLELVEKGKIEKGSALILEELDRLTRQELLEAVHLFTGLLIAGIEIHSIVDEMVYTPESFDFGQLVISAMKLSQGHEESRKKSARLKAAWVAKRIKAANGGEKLTAQAPAWLELSSDRTTYKPIRDRVEIVQRIFRERLAGKGTERITHDLNRDWKGKIIKWAPESPRRDGGAGWRKSYVEKILRNPAVIGEHQHHELFRVDENGKKLSRPKRKPVGDPLPGYYPAVITEEDFYRVQELSRQSLNKGGRNGTASNLFSYIARCGYCGYPMQYVNKGKWRYLACDKAQRRIGCHYLSVPYEEFERAVLTFCKGLDASELLPGQEEAQSLVRLLEGRLTASVAKLANVCRKADNYAEDIGETDDKASRAFLREKLKNTLEEKAGLEKEVEQLKRELETAARSSKDTQEGIESLSQLFEAMDKLEGDAKIDLRLRLRQELRRLIQRIDVYPGGSPLFTPDRAERALEDMAAICPEGTEDYLRIKEELRQRVEDPKDFLSVIIHFTAGSKRTLCPSQQPVLTTEWDKEAGVLRNWFQGRDGQIEGEEYGNP